MEERKNPMSSDSASSDGADAPSEAEQVVNDIANSEGSFIDGVLEETLKALRRAEKQSDRKAASKALGGFGEGLFCHLQGKIIRLCLNDDVYSSALKQIGLFVKGKVVEVWGKVSDGQIPPGWLEFLDERLAFRRRQAEPARSELFHSELGLVIQPHQELVATLSFSDPEQLRDSSGR